jgi:hypothetical protein
MARTAHPTKISIKKFGDTRMAALPARTRIGVLRTTALLDFLRPHRYR